MKNASASLYRHSALSTSFYVRHAIWLAGIALSVGSIGIAQNAYALPQGATVVSGQVTVSNPSSNQEVINQTTNSAIVNWQSFNIGNGETTRINEPSAGSIELDRVSGNASQILGTLTSNGRVWLVNPNGVFFGQGSQVNVAGLIATTANISNSNFNSGNYAFTTPGNPTASVVNQGTITAKDSGLVALIAPGVENDGVITANMGKVQLSSGQTFNAVDLYGDGLYSFRVGQQTTAQPTDNNGNSLSAAVVNTGTVSAKGGKVYMTAKVAQGVVNQVINMTGIVEATTAHKVGGTIVLDGGTGNVNVAGTLNASGKNAGQKGGRIAVASNGGNITLASATLDASGAAGGGKVRIGGGKHGNSHVPQAASVTVDSGSLIDVSALNNGKGGSAVLWSTGATNFAGTILAQGGANSGAGGSIETSGQMLNVTGTVDASAANGNAGTWTLDPSNVLIGSSPAANTSFVSASTVNNTLNGGTNVDITTTSSGTQSGTIEVADNISKTAGGNASFTLEAASDITLDSGVGISSTSGALNVTLDANTAGNGGAIALNSGSSITSNGGNITLGGGATPATGFAVADLTNGFNFGVSNAGTINAGGGNVTINGEGASQTADGVGGVMNTGLVETSGTGNVAITGLGAGGSGNDHDGIFQYGTVETVNGNITLAGTGGNGGQSTDHGIRNYGTNEVTGTGSITATGGGDAVGIGNYSGTFSTNSGKIMLTSTQGDLNEWGTVSDTSGNVTLAATNGNVNQQNGNVSTGGNLTLTSDNGHVVLINGGSDTAGGTLTIDPASISFTNADLSSTGNMSLSAANDITATGSSLTTQGGNITLDANNTASGTGAISLTDSSVTSNGGKITLGGGTNAATGFAMGDATAPLTPYGGEAGISLVNSLVNAGTGNIVAHGTGGNNGQNSGILLYGTGEFETTSGNITLTGNGGATGSYGAYGVVLGNGGSITTATGNINVTGTGAVTCCGFGNGIELYAGSSITSTGSGGITLNGTAGGTESTGNYGLYTVSGNNVIGGASDTGNITINTGSAADLMNVAITTTGNVKVDPTDVSLSSATVSGNNVTVTAGNVSLSGSTLTANGTLNIDNSGTFSSDTAGVLKGAVVKLYQNLPGIIQNAINAINPASGSSTLTLSNGIWNQLAQIVGYNNFTLTGSGNTVIEPTSLSGAPVVQNGAPFNSQSYDALVLAQNGNVNISNLTVNGSQVSGGSPFSAVVYNNAGGTLSNVTTAQGGTFGVFAVDSTASGQTAHTVNVNNVTSGGDSWSAMAAIGNALTFNVKNSTLSGTGGTLGMDYSNGSQGTFTGNTVDAGSTGGIAFHGANNVTISSNDVIGSGTGSYGISDDSLAYGTPAATGITIKNNDISNVSTGINANGGSGWTVSGNIIDAATSSTGTGINLLSLTGTNKVSSNDVSNFATGIAADGGAATISNNTLTDNTIGINATNGSAVTISGNIIDPGQTGISVSSSNATISSNDVIGEIIGIMFSNATGSISNNTLTSDATGVSLTGSNGVTISGNTASNDTTGFSVTNSNNVTLKNNIVAHGVTGVSINGGSGDAVDNNTILVTGGDGIDASGSSNVTVKGNTLTGNGTHTGINLTGDTGTTTMSGNTINNFAFNTAR